MWKHFAGTAESPPGTYYYAGSNPAELFWHMYDQVLLRPDLLKGFHDNQLKILTRAGDIPLLTQSGTPDKANYSDHLPILFRVNLPKEV